MAWRADSKPGLPMGPVRHIRLVLSAAPALHRRTLTSRHEALTSVRRPPPSLPRSGQDQDCSDQSLAEVQRDSDPAPTLEGESP